MPTKPTFSTITLVTLTTLAVVVAAPTTMVGINQQAQAAIAISEKGVKIDDSLVQEGDPIPDMDVKLGKKPRPEIEVKIVQEGDPILDIGIAFNQLEGEPIPDIDVKLGCKRLPSGKCL
jgi:hypothetical protein